MWGFYGYKGSVNGAFWGPCKSVASCGGSFSRVLIRGLFKVPSRVP